MRLSAPVVLGLAAYGVIKAVGADPRRWPDEATRLAGELRTDWSEATAAGRRAQSRAQRRLDRDMARAAEGMT